MRLNLIVFVKSILRVGISQPLLGEVAPLLFRMLFVLFEKFVQSSL